jgi:hypothetical protein
MSQRKYRVIPFDQLIKGKEYIFDDKNHIYSGIFDYYTTDKYAKYYITNTVTCLDQMNVNETITINKHRFNVYYLTLKNISMLLCFIEIYNVYTLYIFLSSFAIFTLIVALEGMDDYINMNIESQKNAFHIIIFSILFMKLFNLIMICIHIMLSIKNTHPNMFFDIYFMTYVSLIYYCCIFCTLCKTNDYDTVYELIHDNDNQTDNETEYETDWNSDDEPAIIQ